MSAHASHNTSGLSGSVERLDARAAIARFEVTASDPRLVRLLLDRFVRWWGDAAAQNLVLPAAVGPARDTSSQPTTASVELRAQVGEAPDPANVTALMSSVSFDPPEFDPPEPAASMRPATDDPCSDANGPCSSALDGASCLSGNGTSDSLSQFPSEEPVVRAEGPDEPLKRDAAQATGLNLSETPHFSTMPIASEHSTSPLQRLLSNATRWSAIVQVARSRAHTAFSPTERTAIVLVLLSMCVGTLVFVLMRNQSAGPQPRATSVRLAPDRLPTSLQPSKVTNQPSPQVATTTTTTSRIKPPPKNARPTGERLASEAGEPDAGAPGATEFVGVLEIVSEPEGAAVTMDGTPVGTTPMTLVGVRAGSHAVRVDLDGYDRWSRAVHLVTGTNHQVVAELSRTFGEAIGPRGDDSAKP